MRRRAPQPCPRLCFATPAASFAPLTLPVPVPLALLVAALPAALLLVALSVLALLALPPLLALLACCRAERRLLHALGCTSGDSSCAAASGLERATKFWICERSAKFGHALSLPAPLLALSLSHTTRS